jgi:hypothetical protein
MRRLVALPYDACVYVGRDVLPWVAICCEVLSCATTIALRRPFGRAGFADYHCPHAPITTIFRRPLGRAGFVGAGRSLPPEMKHNVARLII